MEDNFVDLNSPCVVPSKLPSNVSNVNVSAIPPVDISHANPIPHVPGVAQSYFSGFTRYLKDTSSKVMQTVQK